MASDSALGGLSASGAQAARNLGLGFAALLATTSGLIVLGALVRAHGAGLACPDWPLCFGEFVPPMNLQIGFEWTHRAVAGGTALVFTALAIGVLRRPDLPRSVRRLLVTAAVLLGVQILLGALTVWQLLASWTVTSHLITGNAFNVCLLLLALELRDASSGRRSVRVDTRVWRLLVAGGLLLFVQMVLGGLVSSTYAGLACPDWPACRGEVWFPSLSGAEGLHLFHRWNAILLVAALAVIAVVTRGVPRIGGLALLALVLGLVQVVVGIANVVTGIPVEVTGLHSALAALLVLSLAALLREAIRGRA